MTESGLPSLGRRILGPLIVASVGFLLTAGAHHLIRAQETRRMQTEFDATAWDRARSIEFALRTQTLALESVSSFIALSAEVSPTAFDRFARPLVDRLAGIEAIAWAPRTGPPDATGAGERFVVAYTVPPVHAELPIGFDLTADPSLRAALGEAISTGGPEVTDRRTLRPAGSGRKGRVVFVPVLPPEGASPGIVVAVFSIATVVRGVLGAPGVFDAMIAMWDLDAPDSERLIVVQGPHDTAEPDAWNGRGSPPVIRGIQPRQFEITAYGRRFAVITAPTPALVAERSVARATTLAGGITSSILLSLILFILAGRQARLQLAVAERTAAARASEARYRGIVEDQTELICRSRPDCTITFANAAYAEYWGLRSEQMVGVSWLTLLPEDAREVARRAIAAITPETPTRTVEHEVVLPSGEIRWQQWVDRGLFDEDGRIIEYQSVGRDTTERRRAETALEREKSLLRSLIDSIPDLIFFKDAESVYLGCNRAFMEYAGHEESALIGTTDFDLFPRDVAASYRENDRVMMAARRSRRNEEWIRYPDGRMALLDTLKTPFYGPDGAVLGLIGVSRDITRTREAEDATREAHRKLMTVREEERRRVAEELHEVVCQDIAALRLSLQAMSMELRGADATIATADQILSAASACQDTIGVIRQICYALYPPQLGPMGLRAALLALPRPVGPSGAGNVLSIEIDPELPRYAPALEVALFRVAQEALGNALRHGGAAHVIVRIESGHGLVRLEIEDDGRGFDPDAPPSGLGLSIMRERMIAVGGTLDIASRPGRTRVVATAPDGNHAA